MNGRVYGRLLKFWLLIFCLLVVVIKGAWLLNCKWIGKLRIWYLLVVRVGLLDWNSNIIVWKSINGGEVLLIIMRGC